MSLEHDEYPLKREPPRDLAQVALRLQAYVGDTSLTGYVRGKTRIRNAVMHLFDVSALTAENLVEEMQGRGFIHYTGNPRMLDTGGDPWLIRPRPLSMS